MHVELDGGGGGGGASPWAAAAVLGHHHHHHHHRPADTDHHHLHHHHNHLHPAAAAAAAAANGFHPAHPAHTPMDLHVPQPFPYYRYRDESLCWPERKPLSEDGHSPSMNARILELRKEKSRDAARSRRGKENYEFYELAKMLPLPAAITSQLDKASIIRLTISYLKLRDFSGHGDPPWTRDGPQSASKNLKGTSARNRSPSTIALELFEQHQGTHILQSLDGFAFALAADGRFLYISETVSIYLGLSQVEMTGSSVFDYIHQADHSELAEQLGLGLTQGQGMASPSPSSAGSEEGSSNVGTANPDVSSVMSLSSTNAYKGLDRAFCIRMKSTLTKRGCHFKSSGYRVVLLICRLRPQYTFSHNRKCAPPLLGAVSLAIALPPPSVHEIRLETDMFVTRLYFDFRIAHCEPRVAEILDYTADELTGMNMYTLCHGEDVGKLRKCHLDLINKGQMMTHYYRVMNKNGGYTWMQTCGTVVCNSKNAEEQNIICVNYVVSAREFDNLIMDCCQMEEHIRQRAVKREETGGNDPENGSPDGGGGDGRGGNPRRDHLTPADLDDGHSADGQGDPTRGRNHVDITQLNNAPSERLQLNNNNSIGIQPKKSGNDKRKAHKRKIADRDEAAAAVLTADSCCSSSEEDTLVNRKQHFASLSPASSSCQSTLPPSPPKTNGSGSDKRPAASDPNAVKELEHAMSKHLPPTTDKTSTSSVAAAHQPTDFSTDALLKQQQQKSTIQWIGAHHLGHHHHLHQQQQHQQLQQQQQQQQQNGSLHLQQHQHHHHPAGPPHHHHLQHHQQQQQHHHHHQGASPHGQQSTGGAPGTTLPASALLRQIYANRESVIRANVHAPRSPGASAVSYYAGEMSTLPTPPGSEGGYSEQQQFGPQKNEFGNGGSLAVPPPYSYADYHTAMTPPSSVSPRDKHQHQHQQQQQQQHQQQHQYDLYGPPPTSADALLQIRQQHLHQQYGHHAEVTSSAAPALPLKPQPYNPAPPPPPPPAVPLDHYDQTSAAAAAAAAAFYHSAAGFHLYHPSKSTMATGPPLPPPPPSSVYAADSLKNHHNWYSTPT
ncbi:protein trachealess isoform X1 [Acyrthosiphon pisum]|uniref:Protein trachealess n=2 Tax=Macrosiphini TaxID=33386 RepID=A0A8R2B618_ACYPI|nr:protein trachealess isoform X1 [Acyrthosiphon pisum]|eukprot:XP_008183546.1 PREDICTED: protein trachealess isoform X1 [Acyrthosiphon pisum]